MPVDPYDEAAECMETAALLLQVAEARIRRAHALMDAARLASEAPVWPQEAP